MHICYGISILSNFSDTRKERLVLAKSSPLHNFCGDQPLLEHDHSTIYTKADPNERFISIHINLLFLPLHTDIDRYTHVTHIHTHIILRSVKQKIKIKN